MMYIMRESESLSRTKVRGIWSLTLALLFVVVQQSRGRPIFPSENR